MRVVRDFQGGHCNMPDNETRDQQIDLLREELRPIDEELAALGLPPVAGLGNSGAKYKSAIPLLIRWLFVVNRYDSKSILLSTLQTPWARPLATRPMIEAFRQADAGQKFSGLKWEIGNILHSVADDSIADDLIEIAKEVRHERDRNMAVLALGKLKDTRVPGVLIALLTDADVILGAVGALIELAPVEAVPALERLLSHREPYVRKQAQKALCNINTKYSLQTVYSALPLQPHAVKSRTPVPKGYSETSFACDFEHIEDALAPLTTITDSGFGQSEIAEVAGGVKDDGICAWVFSVTAKGVSSTVIIFSRSKDGDPDFTILALPEIITVYAAVLQTVLEQLEKTI